MPALVCVGFSQVGSNRSSLLHGTHCFLPSLPSSSGAIGFHLVPSCSACTVSRWQLLAATFACCHYASQMASDTMHSIMGINYGQADAHSLKFLMIHLARHLLRILTFYSGSGFWKPVILIALPFRIVSSTSFSTFLFK